MRLQSSLTLTPLCVTAALANWLGPVWPAPRDLSSRSSAVTTAWRNLTTTLETSLHGSPNKTAPALQQLRNLTFSVGMFSLHDSGAETLQYHYAAPEVARSRIGANKVDGDAIYRVASVSKLATVLAAMIELDAEDWDRPLSKLFPPLAESLRAQTGTLDPIFDTQWEQVTPSALACHMAGVSTMGAPWYIDILALHTFADAEGTSSPLTDPATYGLPPLDKSDPAVWPPCVRDNITCTAIPYTEGISTNPPVFLPWTSPVYSDNGFTLLGLAIANLTGKSMEHIYQENIFDPLGMKSSYSSVPPGSERSHSVIVGEPAAGWALAGGLSTPSGGLFSTTNDLAKFGLGILGSTLLSPEKTRKWMKPVTHTGDLHYSVGRPWEIYRYTHPETGVITDIYTKLGDSGYYGGLVALIPDFDAGFSVLDASSLDSRSDSALLVMDLITESVLPALMEQAAIEAGDNFAGAYVSTVEGLNSSITFSSSKSGAPGLEVSSWISNGTDLMPIVPIIMGSKRYRLRPTINAAAATGQVAFTASTLTEHPIREGNKPQMLFSKLYDVGDWTMLDQNTYGGVNIPFFVFDVDSKDGKASAVSPAAWRVKLERKQ